MNVDFKNIGPIKSIGVDLSKKMIVLCGPNNSGKTFLAYSIYGLLRTARKEGPPPNVRKGQFKMLKSIIYEIVTLGSGRVDLVNLLVLDSSLYSDSLIQHFLSNLHRLFATNVRYFSGASVSLSFKDKEQLTSIIEYSENSSFGVGNYKISISKAKGDNFLYFNLIKINSKSSIENEVLISILSSIVTEYYYKIFFSRPYIAPAERIAINIFSRELSEKRNQLVDRLLNYKNENSIISNATRFSWPISDSLQFAEKLDAIKNNDGPLSKIADKIENEILDGKMQVNSDGTVSFISNKTDSPFSIHLSASLVKSLASLVFYCRHIAAPGDVYIIDEPELNLHPDNQRKIVRILAIMINAGIKVILSTHSDYVIRELNNLIVLNSSDYNLETKRLMKKFGYLKNQLLNHEDVGVYLFGTKAHLVPVSAEGFEVSVIDNEINSMNDSSQEIYNNFFNKGK
jgi:energy-coupling factor transporter ATP-binding protein EcfA2